MCEVGECPVMARRLDEQHNMAPPAKRQRESPSADMQQQEGAAQSAEQSQDVVHEVQVPPGYQAGDTFNVEIPST